MANQCVQCGFENDDSSLQCRCGHDLQALVSTSTSEAASRPAAAPVRGRRVIVRVVLACWWLGFLPLLFLLHKYLPEPPLRRTLIGMAVFYVPVLVSLWLLRREPALATRVWRLVLVAWALLLFPLLFAIVDGVAQEGWPRGRFNRTIAHMLSLLLGVMIPVFLAGLGALVQAHRAASTVALAAGVNHIVLGIYVLKAAAPIHNLMRPLRTRIDLIAVGAKLLSYLTIPVGVVLIVGAVLLFRSRRSRAST